jgi:hypothetical protein
MSLIKKIAYTKLGVWIRNITGFRPVGINTSNLSENCSISDAFFWRTSDCFKTIFKFSDLLKIFFKSDQSTVQIIFYDKDYKFIKELLINSIDISNELIIDKSFLNGLSDYGIFYVFHKTKRKLNNSIRNSCYTGYSYNNSIFSFIHGNVPVAYQKYNQPGFASNIVSKSLFKNQTYKIQNHFENFSKSEIFINNPTDKIINFNLNSLNYSLNSNCSKIIDISNFHEIELISNCYFLRPLIINYKNNFFDIYHG